MQCGGNVVVWYGGHFIAVWTENGLVSVANPGEACLFNVLYLYLYFVSQHANTKYIAG